MTRIIIVRRCLNTLLLDPSQHVSRQTQAYRFPKAETCIVARERRDNSMAEVWAAEPLIDYLARVAGGELEQGPKHKAGTPSTDEILNYRR